MKDIRQYTGLDFSHKKNCIQREEKQIRGSYKRTNGSILVEVLGKLERVRSFEPDLFMIKCLYCDGKMINNHSLQRSEQSYPGLAHPHELAEASIHELINTVLETKEQKQ